MAKELPYFQFEPAEYLTKDISFCSLSAQGMFINICAYYWQRGCELTKQQVLRRLNHEDAFNELVDEGVIYINGDDLTISFLKEQYESLEGKKIDSSTKGKIGNLKRWNKEVYKDFKAGKITLDEALSIAKSSGSDKLAIAKTSEIRREEIKEEKKREDEVKKDLFDIEVVDALTVDSIYPLEILKRHYLSNDRVINAVVDNKENKFDNPEHLKLRLDIFCSELLERSDTVKTPKDFASHFRSWHKNKIKIEGQEKKRVANSQRIVL